MTVRSLWDDLRAPATAINPPGEVSDPDWDNTNLGWLFDASGTEIIHVILQLPHSYVEGTGVEPHIHWEPTNTNTGTVAWRLEYRWRNNLETVGAFVQRDITPAAGGTADTLQINTFGMISKSDARRSSLIECKISRIGGSDTYNADARFKEFDIHYRFNVLQPGTIYTYSDDL